MIPLEITSFSDTSFVSYFISEITHGYQLKQDEHLYSEKQRRITTFMKTPRELEKVRLAFVSEARVPCIT